MKNIVLYQHGGSGNHGCEALVRTVADLARAKTDAQVTLCSYAPVEDTLYGVKDAMDNMVHQPSVLRRWSPKWIAYQIDRRFLHSQALENRLLSEKITLSTAKNADLVIAVGGDNYCYKKGVQFWPTDRMLAKQNQTLLWGCSIEPRDLSPDFVQALSCFNHILVRESLSADALIAAGLGNRVRLIPDPAFTLPTAQRPYPDGFDPANAVGINVSPMIISNEQSAGMTMRNYENLVEHILTNTDLSVALIPHVVWQTNDDREPLRKLYEKYAGNPRVCLRDDANCHVLKGDIARLRMFVGARTHSTIAAYSSCVPTLVVGYSVKAQGIAKDLFGKVEDYVLPVQNLKQPNDLVDAFLRFYARADADRAHLQAIMPDYQAKAASASDVIAEILKG